MIIKSNPFDDQLVRITDSVFLLYFLLRKKETGKLEFAKIPAMRHCVDEDIARLAAKYNYEGITKVFSVKNRSDPGTPLPVYAEK